MEFNMALKQFRIDSEIQDLATKKNMNVNEFVKDLVRLNLEFRNSEIDGALFRMNKMEVQINDILFHVDQSQKQAVKLEIAITKNTEALLSLIKKLKE